MDEYEVFTVGQGDLLHNAFQGVVLFANSSFMGELVLISGLLGGALGVFKLITSGSVKFLLTWFLSYLFIFGFFLNTKATVIINDASDPTTINAPIEDVPFGLAFIAHLATMVGDGIGSNLDLAFAPVDGFQYRDNKAFWGPRLMQELANSNILDTNVQRNMDEFFKSCALPRLVQNGKIFTRFKNDNDVWNFLGTTGSTTSADDPKYSHVGLSATTFDKSTGEGSIVTCNVAYSLIDDELTRVGEQKATDIGKRFYPDETDLTIARDNAFADLGNVSSDYMGLSTLGPEMLRQGMLLQQFERSLGSYAGNATDAAMMNFLNARTDTGFRTGAAALGTMVQTGIPLLYTLILILLVGIFPIIMFLAFIPSIGPKVVQNYLLSFVHMQAFVILFVLINTMINFELARQGNAVFGHDGTYEAGLNFERMGRLESLPSKVVATATVMLGLIPLYIGIFKGGVEALGTAFERTLQPYQEAAQQAGKEFSSGNMRYADSGFLNSSSGQINQAPNVSYTGSTVQSSGGGTIQVAGSGTVFAQGMQSNLGATPEFRQSVSNGLRAESETAVSAMKTASSEQTSAMQAANVSTASWMMSHGSQISESSASTFGGNQSYSEGFNALEQSMEEFAASEGVNYADIRSVVMQGSVGLQASFSSKSPLSGGASASATGSGSITARGEQSYIGSVSHNQAKRFLDSVGDNKSLSSVSNAASQQVGSESFNSGNTLSDSQVDSFQKLSGASKNFRESQDDVQRTKLEQQAAFDQTGSLREGFSQDVASAIHAKEGMEGITFAANNMGTKAGNDHITPYAKAVMSDRMGGGFDGSSARSLHQSGLSDVANHNDVNMSETMADMSVPNIDNAQSFGSNPLAPALSSSGGQSFTSDRLNSIAGIRGGTLETANASGATSVGFDQEGGGLSKSHDSTGGTDSQAHIVESLAQKPSLKAALGGLAFNPSDNYPYLDDSVINRQTSMGGGRPDTPDGYEPVREGDISSDVTSTRGHGNFYSHTQAFAPIGSADMLDEARQLWKENDEELGDKIVKGSHFVHGETEE